MKHLWRMLGVFDDSAVAFAHITQAKRGYGIIFLALALEMWILDAGAVAQHAVRLTFDPLGALTGLWGLYVRTGVTTAVVVYGLGVLLYFKRRKKPGALDIGTAASLMAAAYLPHVPWVGASLIMSERLGNGWFMPHQPTEGLPIYLVPLKLAVAYAPCAWVFWSGIRRLRPDGWAEPAKRSDGHPLSSDPIRGLFVLYVLGASIVSGVLVSRQWETLRPVMPKDPLPTFHLRGLAPGEYLSDRDLYGEVVLIDFWATWCPPCVAAMPHIDALNRDLGPKGLHVVSVSAEIDNPGAVANFAEQHALSFPVWLDNGTMLQRFRITDYPTVVLIDRTGHVRDILVGSTSAETLERKAEALLAEAGAPPE